ncbi:MAG: P-loop NTPase, partial [Balneolaceae bacterium]
GSSEDMTEHTATTPSGQTFILAVVSGKGGVGKSMTSVNTADTLNRMGYRVALIDVDIGLSNCATLMNEPSGYSVSRWVGGECCLEDLPQDCSGVTLVTASDDPGSNHFEPGLLMDALDQVSDWLCEDHQFVIIDTPAGAGEMTLWALDKAHLGAVVLVDEPTSVADAYRLCKYVYSIDPGYPFACIVNQAENEMTAGSTFKRFNTILNYFMDQQAAYLGFIPASPSIRDSIRQQRPLGKADPGHSVLVEFQFISANLIGLSGSPARQHSSTY